MSFFDLVRDTLAWQVIRLVTGGKIPEFQFYDERHPSMRQRYASGESLHGTARRDLKEAKDVYFNRTPPLQRNATENVQKKKVSRNPYHRGYSANIAMPNSHWSNETIEPSEVEKYGAHMTKSLHLVQFLPDDPENPRNWSAFKKTFVSFQICLLIACTYAGASIYTVGTEGVKKQFGVSDDVALLGLTMFVLGYGFGPVSWTSIRAWSFVLTQSQMIWSPLSEIPQIGRNSIYITALVFFIISQVPIALATNIGMLLAFRFIAGFFGSPILGSGGGILVDMYAPRKQIYAMGLWALIGICGPTLGPIIGGFAVEAKGWKWAAWIVAWMSTSTLAIMVFFLPETSSGNILYRRALRIRRATRDRRYICEAEIEAEDTSGKEVLLAHLIRPFSLVLTEPVVFVLNCYSSFIYGLMYIWFESLPLAYEEVYHFGLGTRSLALLGLIVGVLFIIPPFFLYYRFRIEPRFDHWGNIEPEKLLILAMIGCLFPPASLVWFGFTAKPWIHWLIPIVGSALFTSGALLLFISIISYLSESYPDHVSSVLAGNELFTSMCGATFPLFVPPLYYKFEVFGSSILLAIFAMAFVPIPFILYLVRLSVRHVSSTY
ncbi:caffeine resistance protein 5 [Colletotrichum sojae]|uniref:Caffeine resistance protein 5 n=1 Tax=Colletotrichum sojae TaxID=2175907 RepID=A0A8H6MWA0_9PEZI|nr:caffeine resistance protein 5 [Colletotrichum sojae]